jgi:hypothetical protein
MVLPFLNNLNQGIEFLVICRVVQNFSMEHFRMIAYWLTSFNQDYSHCDAGASLSHQKEADVESESTPQHIEGAKPTLNSLVAV